MTDHDHQAQIASALRDHPTDRGLRPEFHALWHLRELGIVADLTDFASAPWDRAEASGRRPVVVVMDTPMDVDHPNLTDVVDRALMRDFSVFDDGAFPVRLAEDDAEGTAARRAAATALTPGRDAGDDGPVAAASRIQAEIITSEMDASDIGETVRARHRLVQQVPGAHGTAVAGLIAGKPSDVPTRTAAHLGAELRPSTAEMVELPYAGINPFARIVPVSLTAAPYPDMVLGALDYVAAIGPDVVVIAAAWADAADREGRAPQDDDSTWPMEQSARDVDPRQGRPAADAERWKAVSAKLKAISQEAIVLCAAGNVDSPALVYPALLSAEDDNNIYAVTACDETGAELSYAPPVDTTQRGIKTLSTQLPRADRGETVVDPYRITLPELRRDDAAFTPVGARDIVTLDPDGRGGYNPTEYPPRPGIADEPRLEIGSLYSRFSGTSAATAIAGGLVSLAIATEEAGEAPGTLDPAALFDLAQARALVAAARARTPVP